jgi:hypothetical protein
MKALQLLLLVMMAPSAFAMGVASNSMVTANNARSLPLHTLEVKCRSRNGTSIVDVIFRPQKENPFVICSVSIFDKKGEKKLITFTPLDYKTPKVDGVADGSCIYFEVADELVDSVEIAYKLQASMYSLHYFTIKNGELRKIAQLTTEAEQDGGGQPATRSESK